MMRAVEKYRSDRGANFSTYSVTWMRQRIERYMIQYQYMIRKPVYAGWNKMSFLDDIEDVNYCLKNESTAEKD